MQVTFCWSPNFHSQPPRAVWLVVHHVPGGRLCFSIWERRMHRSRQTNPALQIFLNWSKCMTHVPNAWVHRFQVKLLSSKKELMGEKRPLKTLILLLIFYTKFHSSTLAHSKRNTIQFGEIKLSLWDPIVMIIMIAVTKVWYGGMVSHGMAWILLVAVAASEVGHPAVVVVPEVRRPAAAHVADVVGTLPALKVPAKRF